MIGSRRHFVKIAAGMAIAAGYPAISAAGATPPAFKRIPKAVWAWHLDPRDTQDFLRFAREYGIGRLHLHIGRRDRGALLAGEAEPFASLRALRAAGIELVGLTGDPNWPKRPDRIPRSLQDLLDIQDRLGLFEALNLDIEPHTLPDWRDETRRQSLMVGMIRLLDLVRSRMPGLPVDAALHPRYATERLPDGRPFLEAICEPIQAASLMAFRDKPDAALRWAAPALSVLSAAEIPWRLGVLVHATKEKHTGYHRAGRDRLLGDMTALDASIRKRAGIAGQYRGLIFEHYRGLAEIVR